MPNAVYGDKIRAARKVKRLSAEALGEMLDPPVTYAAIYAWEKGKNEPSITYLTQLCEALGTDISDFIDLPEAEADAELREITRCLSLMNNNQRSAVLGVARAMVDC